ncbi:MAG: hypothetical protein OXN17_15175 [Candidatus Poribacteria bacterium]|nr:hypothetical protein [Candidatus Poribacteria bacterium]MDE0502583.1 hypothetical protein [Candidatus Poribacteria bacterium]
MPAPDFARTELNGLTDADVQFLIENFPKPGRSYEEIASLIHQLPETLESRLSSQSLFDRIRDPSERILQISPFLFFSVLLRRSLTDCRILGDRRVINYLSNLLSIFVQTNRLFRVNQHDRQTVSYLTDMIEEAQNADPRRQFLIYSHIGNYSLYITGLFPQSIEYRQRYKNRPLGAQFYIDFGREYYEHASVHTIARQYELDEVFFRLSIMFEVYKDALNHLAKQYLILS